MDRRQFLQLAAAATAVTATGATLGGCAETTQSYKPPTISEKLGKAFVLENANIVDVMKGEIHPLKRLLVENGKITGFLTEDEQPSHALEIDLKSAYVSPGLINTHCHMTLPCGLSLNPTAYFAYDRQVERNAEECIKHGVTCVRDMLAITSKLKDLKQKIADREIVGPKIVTNCALYIKGSYGDKALFWGSDPFARQIDGPKEAADTVKAAFDDGADFIKIFQQPMALLEPGGDLPVMDVKTIEAICNEADRQGKTVALHQTEHQGYHRGLEGGVHTFEHVVRDAELSDAEVRQLKDLGAMTVPTLSAPFGLAHQKNGDPSWGQGDLPWVVELRNQIMPGMINEYLEPGLAKGSLAILEKFSDPAFFEKKHLLPWPLPEHFTSAIVMGGHNAKRLYDAGIPFGCGNDGGIPYAFPGAIDLELRLMEKTGIPVAYGLKAATIHNAKLMHLDAERGSITPGKVADLVVFEKNPLESVDNLTHPRMVFRDGVLEFCKEEGCIKGV